VNCPVLLWGLCSPCTPYGIRSTRCSVLAPYPLMGMREGERVDSGQAGKIAVDVQRP
jgi:hypothetical protein